MKRHVLLLHCVQPSCAGGDVIIRECGKGEDVLYTCGSQPTGRLRPSDLFCAARAHFLQCPVILYDMKSYLI
jgi:hypothetical protein